MRAGRQPTAGLVVWAVMFAAFRPWVLGAWLAAFAGGGAASAATYLINVEGPMDLATVTAAQTGDTVFRISPSSGAVSVASGAGRRISSGNARSQVSITCRPSRGVDTTCQTDNIAIRVSAIGFVSGRARAPTNFTVSMGTATQVGPATGTNPLAFSIAPPGDNGTRTFFVGTDFGVAGDDSSLSSGAGENNFVVAIVNPGGISISSDTDKGLVTVLRALAITKTADLSFGRIQLPTSGVSTISLDAGTGIRTISGTAFGYPTPAPTRAAFNITGEGGQQVSLSVPASLTLSGPASLTVTLTSSASSAPTLAGTLGSGGAFAFTVGGRFDISNTTPTGAYSGMLTVSVDYN